MTTLVNPNFATTTRAVAASLGPTTGGESPTERQSGQLDAIYDALDRTTNGRDVSTYLRAHPELIRIWDDAAYDAAFPGSGASFDAAHQRLNLPERILQSPTYGATTIAHEGQHALDAKSAASLIAQGYANLGLSVGDAIVAAAHLHNPVTGMLEGYRNRELGTEVSAYRTQAKVARELGYNEQWALGQREDGSVRSDAEILAALRRTSLYSFEPARRAQLGFAASGLAVLSSAIATQLVARKVAPSSYLAAHMWPVVTAGTVLVGAALLQDQLAARATR